MIILSVGNTALLDAVGITIDKIRENRKITKIIKCYLGLLLTVQKTAAMNIVVIKIKSMINSAEKDR